MTSEMITSASENLGSLHFKSQLTTTDDYASIHDGVPTSSMQANNEAPDGLGARAGNTIAVEEVPL